MPSTIDILSHCTPESTEARQLSKLAIVETILACVAYWLLSANLLLLVVGLLVPVLLLKSPESMAHGKKLMTRYWVESSGYIDEIPEKPRKAGILLFAIVLFFSIFVGASYLGQYIENSFCAGILVAYIGSSFGSAFFVAFVAKLKIRHVQIKFVVLVCSSLVCIVALAVLLAGQDFLTALAASIFSLASLGAVIRIRTTSGCEAPFKMSLRWGLADRGGEYDGSQKISCAAWVLVIGFAPAYVLGLLIRATVVRIYATMKFFKKGLSCLPGNWFEICYCTDGFYPSALIPGGNEVSPLLGVKGLWGALESTKSYPGKAIFLFSIVVIWCVALLYRWGLKATFWLWWPISFLALHGIEWVILGHFRVLGACK